MKRLSTRAALWLLIGLATASWAVVGWEAASHHGTSLPALANAAMFTVMLLLWPFLTGWRVSGTKLERSVCCVECGTPQWNVGWATLFCLRCGSTRTPMPATY